MLIRESRKALLVLNCLLKQGELIPLGGEEVILLNETEEKEWCSTSPKFAVKSGLFLFCLVLCCTVKSPDNLLKILMPSFHPQAF